MTDVAAPPSVAIIIVTYNGVADTLECLSSVQEVTYSDYFVVLVDQASEDDTVQHVLQRFPDVMVIQSDNNDGFAAGNNRGILLARDCGADFVFLLNNDTTVAPNVLERLVDAAESDPSIAIVGPLMLYYDSPTIVWSAGGTIGTMGASIMREQGRIVAQEDPATTDQSDRPLEDVDFVVGCGMLVRLQIFNEIGLLDEHFFLYYEETDFCARVRRAGYRVVTQRASRLWHKISRSTGTESELTLYYMRRNVLLYLEKNVPRSSMERLRVIADSCRLALVWMVQGRWRGIAVLARANRDYFLRRLGKAPIAE